MAELIDWHKEFDQGNKFLLDTAGYLADMLPEQYRVVIKYDQGGWDNFNDDKLNIVFSTSREMHIIAHDFFVKEVHFIFQNYHWLDKFELPYLNCITHPLPLGPFVNCDNMPDPQPIPDRKYDFTFIGQIPDTGTRDFFKRGLDKLMKETGDKFNYYVEITDGFGKGLSHDDYIGLLNDSKVVLCPPGASSPETFRFFEAIKMGALPVVERLPPLWYYREAPFSKCSWAVMDKILSVTLNTLNGKMMPEIVRKIVEYNLTILEPKALARQLANITLQRDSIGVEKVKQDMDRTRKEFRSHVE
jgi:hypothetical protein